jgi:hypothetical protein
MKAFGLTKIYCTPWAAIIVIVVLGFCLASCAYNPQPVPKAEYATKIVGLWQGTVGNLNETMSINHDSTFVCQVYPTGFIANTFRQNLPGTIRGTWKITGTILTLRITSAKNERLENRIALSTIVAFREDELVLKSDSAGTSSFKRVKSL